MSFLRCVYRLRHFWRDERANSLMLMGFALPFVIGAAGLGVHTMQLSLVKRQLQREADSAAMAGGYSLFQEQGNTAAIAQANNALTQNDLVPGATATITPGSFTTSTGTTYTSTMYVRLVSNQATPLMALFGRSTSTITAEARAAIVPDGQVCFLALESGTTTGITFAGNSNINLGCGAGTNSISSNAAVNVNGQPSVTASPIVAMGGIPASSAYANGTVLMPNHAELENPFANNSYNPDSSTVSNTTCKNGNNWRVISVSSSSPPVDDSDTGTNGTIYPPGCYGTIDVQGTLKLKSGTYYLANGANNAGLQIGAQGHLTCTGCTFVLTSTTPGNANSFATMDINGGAEVDISASTSGTYTGITIYRDNRASASNQCCQINGNSNSSLSGAFYFPNDTLTFNGTSGMTLNCFQMVALRLAFSGNAAITNTCTDKPGDEDAWQLDSVRLIS
jgi:Flp pilus assembly protein TadG